jgi:hypothetical protein
MITIKVYRAWKKSDHGLIEAPTFWKELGKPRKPVTTDAKKDTNRAPHQSKSTATALSQPIRPRTSALDISDHIHTLTASP